MRLAIETVFPFLFLHLIQDNVEGKYFLVETKGNSTTTPSSQVYEYFVHCVYKIAQGQPKPFSEMDLCFFHFLKHKPQCLVGTVQGGRKCGTSVDHHTEKGDWAYWNYVPELIRRIQKKKIYLDLYLNCRGDRDFEQAIQDLSQYLF